MKTLMILATLLSSVACGSLKQVTPSESTRTEVRTETVVEKDTAYINLPQIVIARETLDTASVIENKYARSAVSLRGGRLVHRLETKPVNEPVIVDRQIVYRDSLVYVDRVEKETVEVDRQLTGWQQIKLFLGGWALLALFIWIACTIIRFLITNKLISL